MEGNASEEEFAIQYSLMATPSAAAPPPPPPTTSCGDQRGPLAEMDKNPAAMQAHHR